MSENVSAAVGRIELVLRDLETLARVRPEVGVLLADVGVVSNLQRAVELLGDES